MKGKLLVFVSVPMIEREYDLYIPKTLKVGAIKKLIVSYISENSDGLYSGDNNHVLYYKNTGDAIDDNMFVKNTKIENGTKLILL